MWWAGEALDAYVGLRQAALWRGGRPMCALDGEDPPTNLGRALTTGGVRVGRWGIRLHLKVWLSGALAPPLVIQPVAGLRSWSEARTVAASQAAQDHGWSAGELAVWLDSLPLRDSALAVVMEDPVRQAIVQAADANAARVVSIRPWWTLALESARPRLDDVDLMAIADSDALVVLASEGQRWHDATIYDPRPLGAQAEAALQRRSVAAPTRALRTERACLASGEAGQALSPEFVASFVQE